VIPTRLRTPAAPLVCSVAEHKSKLNSSQLKKQKSRNDTLAACRSQAARPVQHAAGRLGRARVPGRSQGTQAVYRSSLGVRFGAHYGLKSDIALSPKSATGLNRSRGRAPPPTARGGER